MILHQPKAILFDLDDTLIEGGSVKRLIEDYFELHGSHLSEESVSVVFKTVGKADRRAYRTGEDYLLVLETMVYAAGVPPLAGFRTFWQEHFADYIKPEPGMVEVLDHLKSQGISIGIVTNGGPIVQGAKITEAKIGPWLSCTVTCDEPGFTKPRPEPFQRALSTLHAEPDEAWFVGDHPEADIFGAQRMGMAAIWKEKSFPWDPQHGSPSIVISDLRQLISLLRVSEEATA